MIWAHEPASPGNRPAREVRGWEAPGLQKVKSQHSAGCGLSCNHQVAHQDEVALGLQVERHDVVVVVALGAQLLLGRPLIEPHLGGQCVSLSPRGLPSAAPLTPVQCGV